MLFFFLFCVLLFFFMLEGNDIEFVLNVIRDKGVYGKWWYILENGVVFVGIYG